jgi:hypothetical protein
MEYHCPKYDCIVTELPCPYCGDKEDHQRVMA